MKSILVWSVFVCHTYNSQCLPAGIGTTGPYATYAECKAEMDYIKMPQRPDDPLGYYFRCQRVEVWSE